MLVSEINNRIQNEICLKTILKLKDEYLIEIYKNSNSVKKQIDILNSILNKQNLTYEIKVNIISDYLLHLIPAGTKGVIRGNEFNKIIKEYILDLNLDKNKFQIEFEKKCIRY